MDPFLVTGYEGDQLRGYFLVNKFNMQALPDQAVLRSYTIHGMLLTHNFRLQVNTIMSILALYPKGSCLTSDTSCPCKGNTMFLVEDYEHNSVYRKCSCCCCLTSDTNCFCCMQITLSWMVTWNGYIQVRWLIRSPRCCTRSRRITCSGIRPQSQVC
jgi:hypothetical protein